MKFKAVWEDSSDTGEEAEVEGNSLLEILPRRKAVNKGKERQVLEPLELEEESFYEEVEAEGQASHYQDDDIGKGMGSSPMREMRSARALVPTDSGDYVHPHETVHETYRSRSGTGTRMTTPRGGSIEKDGSDEMDEDDEGGKGTKRMSQPPIPWPAKIGIEPHRVHVMQQSFFHTKNPNSRNASASAKQRREASGPSSFLMASGKKRAREPSVQTMHDQHPAFATTSQTHTITRPARKFVRIPAELSLTRGRDGNYRDLGFAMGKSFRVGWGPGGVIAHIGGLCGVNQESNYESPTNVTVERVRMSYHSDSDEQERSNDLLATLSDYTSIASQLLPNPTDPGPIPFASLSPSFRFRHLVELFHTSNHSHEAELWRLCSALFDEPLDIDIDLRGSGLSEGVMRAIELGRQKEALSDWLEGCVRARVESDLRLLPSSSSLDTTTVAKRLFALMSGNQISRACDEALDSKFLHFATLIAQSPDEIFREEIKEQLRIWREEKVNEVIEPDVLKLYEVLAGNLITEGIHSVSSTDIQNRGGKENNTLDWRRAFGLRLWWGDHASGSRNGIQDVWKEYEELMESGKVPRAIPWWFELESSLSDSSQSASSSSALLKSPLLDAHYLIIKLASLSDAPLDCLTQSLSYSPAALDTKLAFFISLVLGRCLGVKDFSDRVRLHPQTPSHSLSHGKGSGTSHMANSLITTYASMLENVGCVKEAVFVLLFLEEANGRKKAIIDLLSRHAHRLEDRYEGEILKLQIPEQWIQEAKTTYILYQGEIFEGYELALKAGLHSLAHNIAVNDLAPEVVLKGDMRLLRHLFARLNPRLIEGWNGRGKLYLDYANLIILLDQQAQEGRAVEDTIQASELARLGVELPKLIPLMPMIGGENPALVHRAAVQQMATELLKRQTQLAGLGLKSDAITLRKSGLTVDEGTRANYVKAKAYQHFLQAIQDAV